jgi:hypothetical protein
LVDLDVGKPVTRTAFGFTLCREEYKLEISASETDLWSSLLESYFSLKSKVKSTASIVAPEKQIYRELKGIPKCKNRYAHTILIDNRCIYWIQSNQLMY